MGWNRQKSNLEELMVEVLKKKKEPQTLQEIVDEISAKNPEVFTGKTPKKSLYSTIYRREKSRVAKGLPPLFFQYTARRENAFILNPQK